jgi:lipopolysaccharide export system protein LptA
LLTSDKFSFISGGTQLQIYNLGSNNTGATLTATLRKIKPKAKAKRKNRVNSIIVDKSKNEGSGIGSTTLNNGLDIWKLCFWY